MIAAVITVEALSVLCSLTWWSLKLHRGFYLDMHRKRYPYLPADNELSVLAFVGHVIIGLLPVLCVPFALGAYLHHREARRAEEHERLAAELREVEKLLKESRA